jgi:hypothetical protein
MRRRQERVFVRREHAAGGAIAAILIGLVVVGCPSPPRTEPVFPADYASSYVLVRDCRRSPDHDLAFIRVLASPDAARVYNTRTGAFPEGAVIVKEEFADRACTNLSQWSAMRRERGAWRWQEVAADRTVMEDGDIPRCASCHAACGVPPDGYMGTCTQP